MNYFNALHFLYICRAVEAVTPPGWNRVHLRSFKLIVSISTRVPAENVHQNQARYLLVAMLSSCTNCSFEVSLASLTSIPEGKSTRRGPLHLKEMMQPEGVQARHCDEYDFSQPTILKKTWIKTHESWVMVVGDDFPQVERLWSILASINLSLESIEEFNANSFLAWDQLNGNLGFAWTSWSRSSISL